MRNTLYRNDGFSAWLPVSAGILLLYGCAEVKYVKHGATEADFEADRGECRSHILMASPVPTIPSGQMGRPDVREGITTQSADQSAQREVDQCLREKGWIPESQSR